MWNELKKWMPVALKCWIREIISQSEFPLPSGRRVLLFLAADYGNIGDIAITRAQSLFLAKYANAQVVEVPISRTLSVLKSIRKQVRPDDLITLVGGGNMGSLYPDIEMLRQRVIAAFPINRVVCFPQTLDRDDSKRSSNALVSIRKAYSAHPDITVFARESVTLTAFSDLFKDCPTVHVGYSPDVVLSMTPDDLGLELKGNRAGVILCLRDDKERYISDDASARILASVERSGQTVTVTDTHVEGNALSAVHCAKLLEDKIWQFASSSLVITDRLHGMILATISGTPCLVLPNANHKIRKTHSDWLLNHSYIQFVEPEQMSNLDELIANMLITPKHVDSWRMDTNGFYMLEQAVNS